MFARQLTRELAVLIAIKAMALAILFFLFFGPTERPKADADTIARALLSQSPDRAPPPKKATP